MSSRARAVSVGGAVNPLRRSRVRRPLTAVSTVISITGNSVTTGTGPGAQTGVLAGFTSQQYPAFFKIADAGRTLTLGAIALNLSCTSGDQVSLGDAFVRLHISANGKIHGAETQAPTAGTNGETYAWTDSLTARLNRKHTQLSGTWELAVNYSFTNGMSDHCASGPVRFIATG